MDIYAYDRYASFVADFLDPAKGLSKRGAKARLAEVLKCHPTYISQVCQGQSPFNLDQAIGFCGFASLDEEATRFFIDLLQWDRASTAAARSYFRRRIDKARHERLEPSRRIGVSARIPKDAAQRYYQSWLPQAVHMLCQTRGEHTSASLAARLGVCVAAVEESVNFMVDMGVLERANGRISSRIDAVHAPNESPVIRQIHQNWRYRTVQEMQQAAALPGMHFSAAMSISSEVAVAFRARLARLIEELGGMVTDVESDAVYAFSQDFFRLDSRQDS